MKKLLLLSILVGMSVLAWSQQVKWGPSKKGKVNMIASAIVSHHDDHTIVLNANGFPGSNYAYYITPQLERINSALVSTLNLKVNPEFGGKSLDVKFCFEINGQIYIFCTFTNRELEKRFLFVQKVNATNLQLEGNLQKIAELSTRSRGWGGDFAYAISRDSSKLLVYANTLSKKDEPERYSLFVFDQDIHSTWEKEVTLPYTEKEFEVQDFTIDNDGNVFLLGTKGKLRGLAFRNSPPNYRYHILSYLEKGNEVEEYEIALGDKFLTDVRIDVSPKKDIVCAGFYSEQGTFSIKGTYYLRINRETKDIEKISTKEFDMDFITMNLTERQEERANRRKANGKNVELLEYDLRDIIPRADGGAVLLGEQFFVRVSCTQTSNGTSCTTYYFFNDVIVVSISKNGDIDWAAKVPKRQTSANDGGYYSSYAHMVTDDALYLVYNDHLRNLDPEIPQGRYSNFALGDDNGIVVVAKIASDGTVTRKALFPNTEIKAITVPKLCKQINKKEMLMYAKRRKTSQFGMASF